MADLIDRAKLIEALGASCSIGGKCAGCKYENECDDLRIINNQPSAVVHCKDCVYAEPYEGEKVYICNRYKDDGFTVGRWRTDFCPEGVEKEE